MEFNSSMPIYMQVIDDIKIQITTGKLALGQKLPSVRELALQYTINPNTASRVYSELEREGICFTRRGMGTFVTEEESHIRELKELMARDLIENFLEGMQQLGFDHQETIRILQNKGV